MTALAVGLFALSILSLYGWGALMQRALKQATEGFALTAALGLAAVIFIGGGLNLLRIAYGASLAAVLLVGVALAAPRMLQWFKAGPQFAIPGFAAVTVAAIILFVTATQLAPSAFNYADDFQKYFAYPARMLETGTLFGSTANSLGAETLGAKAFLDAFAVAALPLPYLNGVDAVLGLFLCLCLAASLAPRGGIGGALSALPVIAIVFINPMYANSSAIYLGGACIMAAVLVTYRGSARTHAIMLGALYAAMIALKTTFALFVALHLIVIAMATYFATRSFKAAVSHFTTTALAGAGFLAPWLALHLPNYILPSQPDVLAAGLPGERALGASDFFSFQSILYGGDGDSLGQFSLLLLATIFAGAASFWMARGDQPRRAAMLLAAAITGCAAYLVFLLVLAPMLAGYGHSLRYFAPVAIGVVPVVLAGLVAQAKDGKQRACAAILCAVPVLLFLPSAAFRAEQIIGSGNALAFSDARLSSYREFNDEILNGGRRDQVKAVQEFVPPGEPISAWMGTPFYLDYARNPVTDINTAGLAAPWAQFPDRGVAIFEYAGPSAPSLPADASQMSFVGKRDQQNILKAMAFTKRLAELATPENVLHNDGQFIVFRLPAR